MKKIYYILLTFFIISLASCNFFFSEQLIEEDDTKIFEYDYEDLQGKQAPILTGRIYISGAVPGELDPSFSNNNARTAIPTAPSTFTYRYKINDGSYSTLTVAVDGSFSIELPKTATSVTVTVQAFTAASAIKPMLEGSITILQANYNDTINDNITLEPIATGTGTVNLAVKTEVSTVVRCFANWIDPTDGSNMLFQELDLFSGSAYFTMDSAEVRSGAHEVEFIFQNAGNNVVYRCKEKINIFSTLETNKWLDNGSIHIDASAEGGKGALRINQTCLDIFTRHDFYVSNSPDSQGTGTYFDPVSFEDALRFINSVNDGTSQYTIYVKNTITASADNSDWPKQADGTTPADSYITIDPSATLKLKIASYGNPATPYKIDANRSAANPGRVMYIGAKAEVTLKNITVTGGCSTNNGAGVYVNSGALYLNSKASVSYNKMAAVSKYAAGVYNNKGTLSLGNGSEISYNGDETFLPNAGGLYSQNGKFYMEPGSEVHHNYANSGAGVKLNKPVDGYIHGAKIYSNEIKGASGNGGGLFVSSTNFVFEIKDTDIYSNKAYKGAGALVQNALFKGTTIFKENEAYTGGGGLYSSDLEITVTENVVFENNKAPDGSAIYVENKVAKNELSDSFKFVNTTELQTVFLEYDTAAETPVITLGNLTGTAADQKINLIINKKSGDNYVAITASDVGVQIISPADGSVDLSAYVGNIAILNNDLTASGYKIDSNGKLAEKAVIGPNGGNASSAYTVVSTIEACGGTLPAAGVYSLSTEAELEQLAVWSEGGGLSGYTFVLYDNVPLTSSNFNTICKSKNFAGTFDGNGNKITGLSINSTSSSTGLFGKGSSCTIKNLYVEGKITSSAGTIGGIIGTISASDAVIDNCVSNVEIICTSGGSVGGIVGNAASPVTNCINLGNITGSSGGSCVGGIAGTSNKNIINCANFGAVTGHMNVAGICGQLDANGIANCYNYGKITADSSFGAIEGKGSAGPFSELYYHPNSGVIAAVYNKADNIDDDIGTFTDPDALRLTLNTNLQNPAYSSLSLLEWKYNYKINGVKFPVCTTFVLPEKNGVNLSDLASAPSDSTVPYIMKTQSDIEKLSGWVNSGVSFAGFEFKIPEEVSTIALMGDWTPIGTSANPFKGTFDGGNVNISSVAISGGKGSGFFGYVENATIRNVKLDGSLTVTGADCGGLAGSASGNILIENCDIKMVVNGGSNNDIGGVLGYYDGDATSNITIRNCINRSSITGTSNIGGIVGLIYSVASNPNLNVIENCANYGGVTGTGSNVGGIAGQINKTKMENCLSNPTNVISGTTNVGNICGNASTGCGVNYCYYLTYNSTEEKYCGNETVTPANCNIFRVMDNKYQVYSAGNSVEGLYAADADLCDIMNEWVDKTNLTSPGYLKWKYESSLMEFVE